MNINSIDLLNSRSFLEQKLNLTSDVKNSPIYEKELLEWQPFLGLFFGRHFFMIFNWS